MRILSIKTLVLTLILLVGGVAAVATERPFSASGKGVATFITDEAGNIIGANVTGSGNATHLGLFTNAGKVFFKPDPNDPNLLDTSGEAILTAANGDKLGIVVESGKTDITTGIGNGTFRFSGGTGRFANASGLTEYVVEQNLLTGAYELTIVGKIDF